MHFLRSSQANLWAVLYRVLRDDRADGSQAEQQMTEESQPVPSVSGIPRTS